MSDKPHKASTQRLLDKREALFRETWPRIKKDIAEMEAMQEAMKEEMFLAELRKNAGISDKEK